MTTLLLRNHEIYNRFLAIYNHEVTLGVMMVENEHSIILTSLLVYKLGQ